MTKLIDRKRSIQWNERTAEFSRSWQSQTTLAPLEISVAPWGSDIGILIMISMIFQRPTHAAQVRPTAASSPSGRLEQVLPTLLTVFCCQWVCFLILTFGFLIDLIESCAHARDKSTNQNTHKFLLCSQRQSLYILNLLSLPATPPKTDRFKKQWWSHGALERGRNGGFRLRGCRRTEEPHVLEPQSPLSPSNISNIALCFVFRFYHSLDRKSTVAIVAIQYDLGI